MRAVVQRVSRAAVTVDGEVVGTIGSGLCVLLGVAAGDEESQAVELAAKIARLRIFSNEEGRFDQSALERNAAVLVVSQFTLIADTRKGNRPSFSRAAEPALAERLYLAFVAGLASLGLSVETGRFGTAMQVEIVNDGPVTIVLER